MRFPIPRAVIDKLLALSGAAIVLVQLLMLSQSPLQVATVIFGVLLIYVGIWRLSSHFLPERRTFTPLRAEVNEFIRLVRKLNVERARGDFTAAFETSAELREAVEQVVVKAGVQPEECLGAGIEAELYRQTLGSA